MYMVGKESTLNAKGQAISIWKFEEQAIVGWL